MPSVAPARTNDSPVWCDPAIRKRLFVAQANRGGTNVQNLIDDWRVWAWSASLGSAGPQPYRKVR
jgi:hypothetical protein